MSLRPGSRAAGLLLELWGRQGEGQRWTAFNVLNETVKKLLAEGYIAPREPYMALYTLTEAGRAVAQTLERGTPEGRQV